MRKYYNRTDFKCILFNIKKNSFYIILDINLLILVQCMVSLQLSGTLPLPSISSR